MTSSITWLGISLLGSSLFTVSFILSAAALPKTTKSIREFDPVCLHHEHSHRQLHQPPSNPVRRFISFFEVHYFSMKVCWNSTHIIMNCRYNGNWLFSYIYPCENFCGSEIPGNLSSNISESI